MTRLVTIIGGSGFVGRYIARRMAKEGWRVRVAVRRPNEALFVKPYGDVGQVEPVQCNIRDEASLRNAIHGAEAVVNCVGILNRSGKNTFDAVQAEGAGRVARIAAEMGVAGLLMLRVSSRSGSKITMSASLPTAMVPFLGNIPNSLAAAVEVSSTNRLRDIRPALTPP